jgi:Ca2+-binding RTX toxin-like protein
MSITSEVSARRRRETVLALLSSLLVAGFLAVLGLGSPAGAAGTVVYTKTQTIPVPPASNFAGSGGGDGWAVAMSASAVYNVFHHQGTLSVACHLQSNAAACYSPITLTEGGHNFGSPGHPGMYLDQATGKLYVFGTRDDATAGVVCFDTVHAPAAPFCGFTPLSTVGHGSYPGMSAIGNMSVTAGKLYAVNYFPGVGVTADQNRMLCFDVATGAACAGQPYALAFGAGNLSPSSYPAPQVALIGGRIIAANYNATTGDVLTCFDPVTTGTCTGTWPIAAPTGYTSTVGAPFPLLSPSGVVQGFCLPTSIVPCFTIAGVSTSTPAGMTAALFGGAAASDGWNGPALVLGSRVYLANGNTGTSGAVYCYSAAAAASCPNFPKSFTNLGYLYTVNADPARPSCIWVNGDYGSAQIQNFDAFTGGACGVGAIRVLASSFVVNAPQCTPGDYTRLQVLQPGRSGYTTGSVQFLNGDASSLGIADRAIDSAGGVPLSGLALNSTSGLPQFLITLNGAAAAAEVKVQLTWTGTYDPACVGPGVTVSNPAPTAKCHGRVATIVGTDGNDKIKGTNGDDVIVSLGGKDKIKSGKGRDVICSGAGNDKVGSKGPQAVYVKAGGGDDTVTGGRGDDTLVGGGGDDALRGRDGDDHLSGGGGHNLLDGGPGNDTCTGPAGDIRHSC